MAVYSRTANSVQSDSGDEVCVRVAVRCRPLITRELLGGARIAVDADDASNCVVLGGQRRFTFDRVFGINASQQEVYDSCVAELVDACFDGYNATVLAYGQTGSGKTFTMGTSFDAVDSADQLGIAPRVARHLFEGMAARQQHASFRVRAQFLEIYNEELKDLLAPPADVASNGSSTAAGGRQQLVLRENDGQMFVVGASEVFVQSEQELLELLRHGTASRATSGTLMNDQSSRSHAIFTVLIEQRSRAGDELRTAKLNLVDLAGSERIRSIRNVASRLKETVNINQGLLALGNVISALGDERKRSNPLTHVPYRDSKLTRLLQDSLGGNHRTCMIACISSSDDSIEETLNTLKYANRARNIRNKPLANRASLLAGPQGWSVQAAVQQATAIVLRHLSEHLPPDVAAALQLAELLQPEQLAELVGASLAAVGGVAASGGASGGHLSRRGSDAGSASADFLATGGGGGVGVAQGRQQMQGSLLSSDDYQQLLQQNAALIQRLQAMQLAMQDWAAQSRASQQASADLVTAIQMLHAEGRVDAEVAEALADAARACVAAVPPSAAALAGSGRSSRRTSDFGSLPDVATAARAAGAGVRDSFLGREEVAVLQAQVAALSKQLAEAQDDLARDEVIFATKIREIQALKRENVEMAQDCSNLAAANASSAQALGDMQQEVDQLRTLLRQAAANGAVGGGAVAAALAQQPGADAGAPPPAVHLTTAAVASHPVKRVSDSSTVLFSDDDDRRSNVGSEAEWASSASALAGVAAAAAADAANADAAAQDVGADGDGAAAAALAAAEAERQRALAEQAAALAREREAAEAALRAEVSRLEAEREEAEAERRLLARQVEELASNEEMQRAEYEAVKHLLEVQIQDIAEEMREKEAAIDELRQAEAGARQRAEEYRRQVAELQERVAEKEAQLAALREQLSAVDHNRVASEEEKKALRAQFEEQIEAVVAQMRTLEGRLREQQARLMAEERQRAAAKIESLQAELGRMARQQEEARRRLQERVSGFDAQAAQRSRQMTALTRAADTAERKAKELEARNRAQALLLKQKHDELVAAQKQLKRMAQETAAANRAVARGGGGMRAQQMMAFGGAAGGAAGSAASTPLRGGGGGGAFAPGSRTATPLRGSFGMPPASPSVRSYGSFGTAASARSGATAGRGAHLPAGTRPGMEALLESLLARREAAAKVKVLKDRRSALLERKDNLLQARSTFDLKMLRHGKDAGVRLQAISSELDALLAAAPAELVASVRGEPQWKQAQQRIAELSHEKAAIEAKLQVSCLSRHEQEAWRELEGQTDGVNTELAYVAGQLAALEEALAAGDAAWADVRRRSAAMGASDVRKLLNYVLEMAAGMAGPLPPAPASIALPPPLPPVNSSPSSQQQQQQLPPLDGSGVGLSPAAGARGAAFALLAGATASPLPPVAPSGAPFYAAAATGLSAHRISTSSSVMDDLPPATSTDSSVDVGVPAGSNAPPPRTSQSLRAAVAEANDSVVQQYSNTTSTVTTAAAATGPQASGASFSSPAAMLAGRAAAAVASAQALLDAYAAQPQVPRLPLQQSQQPQPQPQLLYAATNDDSASTQTDFSADVADVASYYGDVSRPASAAPTPRATAEPQRPAAAPPQSLSAALQPYKAHLKSAGMSAMRLSKAAMAAAAAAATYDSDNNPIGYDSASSGRSTVSKQLDFGA